MSTPTPDLNGVYRTDIDWLLAMSDALVKGKKLCWDFIYNQYADLFKTLGDPMDHAITRHIELIDKSA